ncbi:glycosyltransferase family 2 protein [Lacticaseibacillus paracasei]|uniref:Glycosyl transferase, family 2 n=1 Tax=Lacticaseibacillus paracasei subsp. paracasei CNCM I-4270 TaxID=1256202 RepID=A0A8E0INV3_LACPA|nr:glycosyltransferase family 2 protein [Lacticaseibacillus paracasei]EPC17559.1 Alpha-L-Rha alpha-1,3-L-rhamnosyltransferase [Lacticaseibacillus paracasei subsp. paracasei Lpp230]EPC56861.1 glycosyl transferase, family 2 [Lacticaseibacillus paracasei subsp. paracasei CNCM I-4270]MCT3362566.1 glycosyltransferase family 2 protein [Lacticaseibacillus paracasei]UNG76997.1 glycosyltransferase family 2 protein [Lacticaseibacillus paracasei]
METGNLNVAICLATYNGEEFLENQIESIVSQSFSNWKLFIRDDGSEDRTPEIIKQFVQKYPSKIFDLSKIRGGGSSKANFFTILHWVTEYQDSDYYMFCDQDDVWLPDKIALSISAIGVSSLPKLVHTDLKVVDGSLNTIANSFISYSNLDPRKRDFAHILVQNNVTGCTMLWNRSLNKLVDLQTTDSILMHDWWIALIAASFGTITFISTPTILYRQHEENVVGAQNVRSAAYVISKLRRFDSIRKGIQRTFDQAQFFHEEYNPCLRCNMKNVLDEFLRLPKKRKIGKIYSCIRNGFLKQSVIQIIGQFIFV